MRIFWFSKFEPLSHFYIWANLYHSRGSDCITCVSKMYRWEANRTPNCCGVTATGLHTFCQWNIKPSEIVDFRGLFSLLDIIPHISPGRMQYLNMPEKYSIKSERHTDALRVRIEKWADSLQSLSNSCHLPEHIQPSALYCDSYNTDRLFSF